MEAKSAGNPGGAPPLHIITQTIMGTIITMDIIICMITATTLILITTVSILTILAIIITTTLIPYNSYYYDYYYYPRYNRTVNLLASGLFGVAAVGSFVDWLFD